MQTAEISPAKETSAYDRGVLAGSEMVDTELQLNMPHSQGSLQPFSDDRCLGHGLGSNTGRYTVIGPVDETTNEMAFKQ